MTAAAAFFDRGWIAFPEDPDTAAWAAAARPVAEAMVADPRQERRCDGTWFPGVNGFPNDAAGAAATGAPPLAGAAVDFAADALGLAGFAWDAAQISACAPGYPRHGAEESAAAFGYRLRRDAAHVDGLLRIGASRRRYLGETHGFILGLPLAGVRVGASPLVVWEGSHQIMRAALTAAFAGVPPARWTEIDVTDAYHDARRMCFERCRRVAVSVPPGAAYMVHRLALHGVAPWTATDAASDWRVIAYFRPDPFPGAAPDWWLERA